MDATHTSITSQMESFLQSAKKLEDALAEERKRSQKIAQEYLATRTKLENAVRELQARLAQREKQMNAMAAQLRETTERDQKNSAELAQFKSAWTEVLAREAQARELMLDHEKAKHLLADRQKRIKALEASMNEKNELAAAHSRRAETYHRELQTALLRLQKIETKHNQTLKDLAILTENQRTVDQASAQIQATLTEQFRREFASAKERLRIEMTQAAAAERDRTAAQVRREADRTVGIEREARFALEVSLEQTRKKLQEAETAVTSLRNETAILRMEANTRAAEMEGAKKEATKTLLMERLKFEAAMNEMREKIEALTTTGLYAEKISSAPEGTDMIVAHPVNEAPAKISSPSKAAATL